MTRLWHIIHQVFKGNYKGQTTVINRKPRKAGMEEWTSGVRREGT